MKSIQYLLAAIAMSFLFISCNSDDDNTMIAGNGDAEFFFDNGVNGDEFFLNTAYTNSNNETLKINKLNYIISNIVFIDAAGNEVAYPKEESYFIINEAAGMQTIHLENVPAGDYKKVRFGLGVDKQRYLQGETAQQSFWDLATANDMTWTWSTGYRFINMEGVFATTPGGEEKVFQVHQGSNSTTDNYREVTLDLPTTARVRTDEQPSIHIKTNINVLLDGAVKIKLQDNLNQAGTAASVMGGQNLIDIANNSQSMFVVDHVHNGSGSHHE